MADSDIGAAEVALVNEVLRSRALSCGPMGQRFEEEWAERLGSRFAVGVSSGTAGLHLSMVAAGVGDGDLVITSPYSFVASANAILYQRAVPIFVDVDPVSLNIDPAAVVQALADLAEGGARAARWLPRMGARGARQAKAVLPIHVFGRPAAMPPIVAAAHALDAVVIEDACEAVGAEYQGRVVGTFGDASVFGFFPNKQIAMGEGGVIATDRPEWADLFRSLRNQGRNSTGEWLEYSRLGFNYRLADMSAAVGLAQLRRMDELLDKRAYVAECYTRRIIIDGVTVLEPTPQTTRMSWFVYIVRLDPEINRKAVIASLASKGIPSRPYFPSIHLQPFYREQFGFQEGDFPVAEAASQSTLALPFHGLMTTDDIDQVVAALHDAVSHARRTPEQPIHAVRVAPSHQRASLSELSQQTRRLTEQSTTGTVRRERRRSLGLWDQLQLLTDEALETLLPRKPVSLPMDDVRRLLGKRRVVVTGAGGSIGSELCRQIADCGPASLVMVDRYENGLHAVATQVAGFGCARAVIGDVTDPARLEAIMSDARPEVVLHAAAHKHVSLMEDNPCEAVKNNVIGTRMVVDAAIRVGAEQFVLVSTDKAVRPASVMGATKRAAELIVQRAALGTSTRCVIVRFGNVLGSNGSVLHTFVAQVRAGGPVTVTHPDVRRFFMLVSEAVHLVLHAAAGAPQGSIAVLDIGEQIPIVTLAQQVISHAGASVSEVPIVFTGLRPGEKLSEELVGDGEQMVHSALPGIGWVTSSHSRDWNGFDGDLQGLQRFAEAGAADLTRVALERLLQSFGGTVSSGANGHPRDGVPMQLPTRILTGSGGC